MRNVMLASAVLTLLGLVTSLCGWRWAFSAHHGPTTSPPPTTTTDPLPFTTVPQEDTRSTDIVTSPKNAPVGTLSNGSQDSFNHSVNFHSTTTSRSVVTEGSVTIQNTTSTTEGPANTTIEEGSFGIEQVSKNTSHLVNSTEDDVDYVKMGIELLDEATQILDTGIWDFERRTEDGDAIFSRQLDNGNMVYRLTGIVDMPAQDLLVIIYDDFADYPKWNPSLLECRVLEKINEQTDISYTVSAPGARGYVSSRDFVSVRHWDKMHISYVVASKSIDFPSGPSNPDYIRGRNGPGCMALRPLSSDPSKTEFRWLLNTKLNGWIPSYIADKAYKKFMTKYMAFLREYCKIIKQRVTTLSPLNTTTST